MSLLEKKVAPFCFQSVALDWLLRFTIVGITVVERISLNSSACLR